MKIKVLEKTSPDQKTIKFKEGGLHATTGTPNKVTAETKERIQRVINALDETLLEDCHILQDCYTLVLVASRVPSN